MAVRRGVAGALIVLGLVASPAVAESPVPAPSAGPVSSASVRWTGKPLTTERMSAADAAVIDTFAQAAMKNAPGLPGMWIGVWDPAKGFYLQAYGEAVKGGDTAAIDQHGRIGSVSKTFTVAAILQQVAAGTLRLDSTIGEVIPGLAAKHPDIADITVEQLSGMTSGIQDYANSGAIGPMITADPHHAFSADELIELGLSLPLAAPGTGGYSTTNIIILGEMLEKVTGRPVGEVVTELARSLGMHDTALPAPEVSELPGPPSHGYVEAAGAADFAKLGLDIPVGTDVTDWSPSWGGAGGAMYSTIEDLGRWAATGFGTSLLPPDLADKRLDFHPIGPDGSYGLGLMDFGKGWVGHTGQITGWNALVLYDIDSGAAFVAIDNETASLGAPAVVASLAFPDLSLEGG